MNFYFGARQAYDLVAEESSRTDFGGKYISADFRDGRL